MRWVAAFACLSLAGITGSADAAVVARVADDAALALTASGSPRIAYASGGALFLASPRANGSFAATRIVRLPSGRPRVAGLEVDARGRSFVLVEDEAGSWLLLADRVRNRWRVRSVPEARPAGAVLGAAGLELDRVGRPSVGYAYRLPDRKTFLRLAGGGDFRTIPITREGFPESTTIPAAAPLLMPDGKIRVLETYSARGGGAILWRHNGSDWRGLFLASSIGGTSPVGAAFARADGERFAAAWTLAGPTPGELQVRLATRLGPQSDTLHRHALAEALTLAPEGPELAATERVGDLTAGLLLAEGRVLEVDGRPLALEAAADGSRHLLLAGTDGLEWYRTPARPTTSVSLTASAAPDGAVALAGGLTGVTGGTVDVYRELGPGRRDLAGTALVAPDGAFTLVDRPSALPLRYRAVYRDPLSGIPYASLLRRAVGS
jgi:hypothetical protein